ncbi:hypothetical protein Daudx_0481 [Candidatus Desulforudis audaxviator]|nr:hypothetical protein Daudx_0481 [Candidatus Desulforudis audaxviator]
MYFGLVNRRAGETAGDRELFGIVPGKDRHEGAPGIAGYFF